MIRAPRTVSKKQQYTHMEVDYGLSRSRRILPRAHKNHIKWLGIGLVAALGGVLLKTTLMSSTQPVIQNVESQESHEFFQLADNITAPHAVIPWLKFLTAMALIAYCCMTSWTVKPSVMH